MARKRSSRKRGRKTVTTRRGARKSAPRSATSPWRLSQEEIERALVTGERERELEELFGPEELRELRSLARQASTRALRGGKPVLILPGIMGSKLGVPDAHWFVDDVYWLDPLDVLLGNLKRLALPEGSKRIRALGVFLLVYLRCKLWLRSAGYDAEFHAYDWRRGIAELGAELAQRIAKLRGPTSLVAHSMGGLVARAALKAGAGPVDRIIQLGTPNYGSFAPVLAMRGVHDVVRKVAALDLGHDKAYLIGRVFSTFSGLCELLPSLPGHTGARFFQLDAWPQGSAIDPPRAALLEKAAHVQEALAPVDERMVLVAGVGQETVVGAELDAAANELVFRNEIAGDGTVPLELACVTGLKTYYVAESHGSLPSNGTVLRAVRELLADGSTALLADEPPAVRRGPAREVRESALRAVDPYAGKPRVPQPTRSRARPAPELSNEELRWVLGSVAAPSRPERIAPTWSAEPDAPWNRVVVGRARQHRIDLQLAHASITDVEARAYVLGLFREVAPTGAASAIDARLDGTITEFTRRRMFSGNVGEVFVMPAGRRNLRAEMVLFAGLGYFDRFNDDVQQLAAENVMRTFARTRVEDFATVLLGAASGWPTARLIENLLRGILRGKLELDHDHHFRRVVLCELDEGRYQEIRAAVARLASTRMFEDVELTLTELAVERAPEPVLTAPGARGRSVASGPDPLYLLVRQVGARDGELEVQSSLLTSGAKAMILSDTRRVPARLLEQLLETATKGVATKASAEKLGRELAELLLAPQLEPALLRCRDRHLAVVHDGPSSRIPWELLRLGDWIPALEQGMSRRLMADYLSVAKYMEERADAALVRMLLVVNPTEDLDGAEKEGARVEKLMRARKDVRLDLLHGEQATRAALLARLRSGAYDLVHYAGHAFFDPEVPSRSGLLCAGEEELTGIDLSELGNLPRLVFFNACESGRVRKVKDVPHRKVRAAPAEAFLRGGIANFIGTYWPVFDDAAEAFSAAFYSAVLEGAPLGRAVLAGRSAAQKSSSDWADYIHYGEPEFVLFPGNPRK